MFLSGKVDPCYPETGRTSFPRSRTPQSRIGLADAPVSLPGRISGSVARDAVHLRTDTIPGEFVSLFLSRFSARCRDCSPPGLSVRPDRKPNAADRKIVALGCRTGPECRLLSGRSGSRPAPEPPPRRSPAEASYSVRTDTAIIYLIMWRTYPPRSCDISQPRLEAHRPCLRPFPATRSLPTEESSRAKAKASETRNPVRQGI